MDQRACFNYLMYPVLPMMVTQKLNPKVEDNELITVLKNDSVI